MPLTRNASYKNTDQLENMQILKIHYTSLSHLFDNHIQWIFLYVQYQSIGYWNFLGPDYWYWHRLQRSRTGQAVE